MLKSAVAFMTRAFFNEGRCDTRPRVQVASRKVRPRRSGLIAGNAERGSECLILMCGDNRVVACHGHSQRKKGVHEYVDDFWHGATW
jgi:hypothetical protein